VNYDEFHLYFFGATFCVAGFAFACGKVHTHLSAWKAMPQEEKEKIQNCAALP